jgi:hypothetical protein
MYVFMLPTKKDKAQLTPAGGEGKGTKVVEQIVETCASTVKSGSSAPRKVF